MSLGFDTDYSMVTGLARRQSLRPKPEGPSNCIGLETILFTPICILLLAFPFGICSHILEWGDSVTFWLMFCSMIPLAKILGDATEELAANLKNDMVSGLLNATFGNAVEMIMTYSFLCNHEYLVVKTTLIGSVLSNMLLVLGMSFFAGGLCQKTVRVVSFGGSERLIPKSGDTEKEQRYSVMGALVNTTMLLLSCFCLCLVTVFNYVDNIDDKDDPASEAERYMLPISRACSVLIIMSYIAFVVFQLVTHKGKMADEGDGAVAEADVEEEEPMLSLWCAIALLIAATVVVSVASEYLTNALEGALQGCGMGKSFVGVILIPIVGNACEHASAIRFAMQDRAGISVGIAVGSSVQIALFVAPLSVLMSWAIGGKDGINMDLDFGALDVTVLTLSVIIILAIVVDGKSNWLEGWMLMTAYTIVAVLYWYMP